MQDMGQTPLFMIRDGDEALDQLLEFHGYEVVDPVVMYSISVNALMDIEIPLVTTFCVWEPLAIMAEIWAKGGIGPTRLDVIGRAVNKTGILSRWNEQPAGAAFAAISDGVCMVHAIEILEHQRRQGVGVWMMRQAAFWAAEQGAQELAVYVRLPMLLRTDCIIRSASLQRATTITAKCKRKRYDQAPK